MTKDPSSGSRGASFERALAGRVAEMTFEEIPRRGVETVVQAFVDTVGVALGGAETDVSRSVLGAFIAEPAIDGDPLALPRETTPTTAALLLGTQAHALDYDDVTWGLDGHSSACLVPALLAVADRTALSGREAITAYVAGFEAACTIADRISPAHYERGWHPTATFGALGAAAAVARALDLGPERTQQALGIAASTAAGLKRNIGTMTKPLHAGLAARSGVTAALLAEQDVSANATAISGERGFWDLYGDPEGSASQEDSTSQGGWYIVDAGIHVKLFPCCYFTHSSIAAAQQLSAAHGLNPEDILSVDVVVSKGATDALTFPAPSTGTEAKFSMPYTVALGLCSDAISVADFRTENLDDPERAAVQARVVMHTDEALPYDSHQSMVMVQTTNGIVEAQVDDPPGTHDDPPSEADLREKFLDCATVVYPTDRAERLHEQLGGLESLGSLADLLESG